MYLKTLANSYAGGGKSTFVISHPKVAWLLTEPGSEILLDSNPEYAKNIVWWESFIPSPEEDIKLTYDRMDRAILKAFKGCKDGTVDTLGFDNFTYHADNRWIYMNKYEVQRSVKTGNVDTLSMYGALHRYLYKFVLTNLLSFPKNVVVTCHESSKDEGDDNKKLTPVDPTVGIEPQIVTKFREKIDGMFSASIYLEKKRIGANNYQYLARCQKGAGRNAKNRYGLPEIVENISYQAIVNSINHKREVK